MNIIKLPFKIILLPVIAVIYLVCKLIKAATHISCYLVGPLMVLVAILGILLAVSGRWRDGLIFGAIGAAAFAALFIITMIVCHVEDFNGLLVKFVRS